MTTIVIAGGGFGGLQAAKRLNDWIEQKQVTNVKVLLIEKRQSFAIGGTFQFALMKKYVDQQAYFDVPYDRLKMKHIEVIHDVIIDINPTTKQVITRTGTYDATFLIVALGMEYVPEQVPGLQEGAYNICNLQDVVCLRNAMLKFTQGNIVMLVSRKPYKCPPVPFEYIALLDELTTKIGRQAEASLMVITPDPTPVPLKNPKPLQRMLDERKIEFKGKHVVKEIDPVAKVMKFEDGSEISYAILAATYPQKPPACIKQLCNEKGFIPVDVMTLKTKFENVFAIGDNAHMMLPLKMPKPHPKAGGFAINQARPVVDAIIDTIQNNTAWDATSFKQQDVAICYAEVGHDKEVELSIDLFTNPSDPQFSVGEPKTDHPVRKINWIQNVIDDWFHMEKPKESSPQNAGATDTGDVKPSGWCCR